MTTTTMTTVVMTMKPAAVCGNWETLGPPHGIRRRLPLRLWSDAWNTPTAAVEAGVRRMECAEGCR